MRLPIFQVDAFIGHLFAGNPAAVCPLPAWLDDFSMQAIASENNLSETAFLVKQGVDYQLRWFTPLLEVDLCGHATLAAAFVVFHWLEPDSSRAVFHTRSGPLTVERNNEWLYMDFPSQPPAICADSDNLAQALGQRPVATLEAGMYHLAVFDSEEQICTLTPDMAQLMHLERMGVIVTAPGRQCDFVSRVFGPRVGIPEDPVTGSAHCLLAPYWAARLGKSELLARQISSRGGELRCTLNDSRVELAGQAVLYLKGEIFLPDV